MTRLETMYSIINEMENPQNIALGDWDTCFAGEVCIDPRLQEQGLFLNDEDVPAFSTNKDNFEGMEALSVFFGLLPREAFYLFAAASYDQYGHDSQLDGLATHTMFLARLDGIIQQREDNHGYPPRN